MAEIPETVRASIIAATGTIVGDILTKAPSQNEAIRDIDQIVKVAMESLIKHYNANLAK